MKHPILSFATALFSLALLGKADVCAAVVFSDNFDGPQYSDDATLVLGTGQLAHGYWSGFNNNEGTVTTSTTAFLSATRSLALTTPGSGQRAQVSGYFSEDGLTPTAVTDQLTFRFAIRRSLEPDDTWTETFIYGSEGIAGLVYFGNGGMVRMYNSAGSVIVASGLLSDTWYHIEITLPAQPGPMSTYSTSVYAADGTTLLGSESTGFFQPTTDYTWFSFSHSNPASTSYIDNFTATTTIPEGSPIAYGLVGLTLLGVGVRWQRRNRLA